MRLKTCEFGQGVFFGAEDGSGAWFHGERMVAWTHPRDLRKAGGP